MATKKSNVDKFTFWCPLDIQKAAIDPETGQEIMRLGGIASTSDEDSDGEFLDPKGFDIKPLVNSGMVNWHHQAKGQPATIIGEPSKAEIRPEGLYIETDLYPSSQIARDVWDLAQTLEKDSKTRRLGYSIEGKVVKRKSNDKKSPDYKKIIKAIITGVAITHQPKNPKTFANIIKGEIDEDFEDEVEEALDTENGKALKKESVDKKIKNQTFSKAEVIDILFNDIPGIDIEKAENIYSLMLKVANMKGKRRVTDEDISKAYEALGLEVEASEDIQKGDGCAANGGQTTKKPIKKAKTKKADDDDYEDEEEVDEREDKTKERLAGIKGDAKLHREAMNKAEDEEEDDDDDEDGEEEEMTTKAKKVKKGGVNAFDRIEKAVVTGYANQEKFIRALGVMVKSSVQKTEEVLAKNEELLDIVKAQDETISILSEKLEEYGSAVPGFKSNRSVASVERSFAKAEDSDITKAGGRGLAKNQIPLGNKKVIADLLDQATFAKGYDEEFSKACTTFEASGSLPANIISRIKNELGYEIVK
jgi:hypothetical protein